MTIYQADNIIMTPNLMDMFDERINEFNPCSTTIEKAFHSMFPPNKMFLI